VPPSAGDFQIIYYTTNPDGSRGTQMTLNDLQSYVNRARCQCGHEIQASIRIQVTSGGGQLDATQVRTFVGNRCDMGQSGLNPSVNPPCALALDAFTQTYASTNPTINFQPIFLAHGVTQLNANIEDAQSVGNCLSGQGNGGIWVCVEDGSQTDCQSSEFIITGTQNNNVPAGSTGGTGGTGGGTSGSAMGFAVDFQPPQVVVTNFRAEGGDGSLLVAWDQATTTDVVGYRILCADANGNPLPGRGFRPSGPNYGQFYYTQQSLCPDGPFNEVPENPNASTQPVPGGGTTGTTTGTGTGGDTGFGTDGGTGFGVDYGDGGPLLAPEDCCQPNSLGDPGCNEPNCEFAVCNTAPSCCSSSWSQACADIADNVCLQCNSTTTTSTTTSTSTSTSTSTGGTGDTTTGMGTDSGTDSGTGTGTGGDMLPSEGIESLGWDYVCSGHIPATSSSARIGSLDNNQQYQILVVAYDRAGNPTAASEVLTATPRETSDFWEQCEQQGNVCGNGGFCSCRTGEPRPQGALAFLFGGLLGLGGVWRRRRRR
jgi:MYXO-CTERM domain-containing protein